MCPDVHQGDAGCVYEPACEECEPENGGSEPSSDAFADKIEQHSHGDEAHGAADEAAAIWGDVFFVNVPENQDQSKQVDDDEEPEVYFGAEFVLEVQDWDKGDRGDAKECDFPIELGAFVENQFCHGCC